MPRIVEKSKEKVIRQEEEKSLKIKSKILSNHNTIGIVRKMIFLSYNWYVSLLPQKKIFQADKKNVYLRTIAGEVILSLHLRGLKYEQA